MSVAGAALQVFIAAYLRVFGDAAAERGRSVGSGYSLVLGMCFALSTATRAISTELQDYGHI